MIFRNTIKDDPGLFDRRSITRLIIPLAVEQTFTSLMGMADTLMVSGISEGALSSVSCVDTVNILVLLILEAFGVGGNVLCAQYMGRRDEAAVRDVSMHLVMLELAAGAAAALVLFAGSGLVLRLLFRTIDEEVFLLAKMYFRITVLSYPFLGVYTASAALYRSIGNSKLPVIVVTTGNILNVAGNALLIFGFGMGVAGAAWATLFSRIFCCIVMLMMQTRAGGIIALKNPKGFRFRRRYVLGVIGIGMPGAVENGMFQLGKIVIQSIVVTLGTTVIAAQALIVQVDTLISRPALAVGMGMMTVAGQYIGAGRPDIAEYYAVRLSAVSSLCCLVVGVVVQPLVRPLCSLTALSPEAVDLVYDLLLFIAVCKVIMWPGAFSLNYCLKAAGDVRYPMYATTISMWVFRVLFGWLLCRYTGIGLWGIWTGWITDWVVRNLFFIMRFRKGEWKKLKIV